MHLLHAKTTLVTGAAAEVACASAPGAGGAAP